MVVTTESKGQTLSHALARGQILFFIFLVARDSLAAATQRLSELITDFLPGRSTWVHGDYTKYVLGLAFTPLLYGRRIVSVFITYLSLLPSKCLYLGTTYVLFFTGLQNIIHQKTFSFPCVSVTCASTTGELKKKTEPKRSSLMQKKIKRISTFPGLGRKKKLKLLQVMGSK